MTSAAPDLEIFVFPLPTVVLFPATSQPLRIFEPRYVEMVNDALRLDRPIALTSGSTAGTVAGAGRVQLLEENADGTMMILLRSDSKVRLKQIDDVSKPYLIARAETIEERTDLEAGHVFYLHRLMREVSGWLERNIPQPKKRHEFISQMSSDEERVNTACSLLIQDHEWQQKLLEMNDLSERLKTAASLLETGAASH